jgi:protein LSM14
LASSALPFLNSNRVSIITKSEIRYEGNLYQINPQDQNIALSSVRSFGTEGRRPGNEIQPTIAIYDYIVFRGTDIKDIMVIGQ